MIIDIVIVIPIYNDQKSAEILFKTIKENNKCGVKYVFVDNGSKIKLVLADESANNKIEIIRTDQNLGFGGGIQYGISKSESEFIGWMPGNLKIMPTDLDQYLSENLLKENEIIKFRRIGRSRKDYIKTWIAGILQSIVAKENMLDTGGTPTIAARKNVNKILPGPQGYEFESYVLFKFRKLKLKIKRPTISYGNRIYGTSHWQKGLKTEYLLMKKIIREIPNWSNKNRDC